MRSSPPKRVLSPRQLTVLCTSKCTAACRHCCMNSGPSRSETLSWPELQRILADAFASTRLEVVIFAGGEPTLLGRTLLKAIAFCKERGVVTRLVTNAYWAVTPEAARAKLEELRGAGLDELNISTDDYHLDFISLDIVRNAYEQALALDFSAVVIANCFGPKSELRPDTIRERFGGDIPLRFGADGAPLEQLARKDGTLVLLSNARVQRLGRGVAELAEDELDPPPADLDAFGEEVGGCPWAIRSAAISPRGHLLACCGFEVEGNPILDYGDLEDASLADLLDKADDDLPTNLIALVGPVRLMRWLQRAHPEEVSFPRTYRSYCEACHDLVTIRQNREALYRHMDEMAGAVIEARALLRERYLDRGRDVPPLKLTLETNADKAP